MAIATARGPGVRRYRGESRAGWPRSHRERRIFGIIKGGHIGPPFRDSGENLADGLGFEVEVKLGVILEQLGIGELRVRNGARNVWA